MGENTAIEWTDATWNPWTGCHKVGAGCLNCYMYRDKRRYGQDPEGVWRSKDATFYGPLKWKEPKRIFTCSWSDFFIEEADEWREDAWGVIRQTPQHTYLVLTKRPERMAGRLPRLFPANAWLGVTVENQRAMSRILFLSELERVFVSAEPLLEPLAFPSAFLDRIKWMIVGGESGPGARPMRGKWVDGIYEQCRRREIPFFFKQWGGTRKIDGAWGGKHYREQIFHEFPQFPSRRGETA